MKVSFDSLVFTTQRFGGVSRYIASLAYALRELGHEVDILGKYHVNEYLAGSFRGLANHLTKIQKFPPKTRRLLHLLNDACGSWRACKNEPDIYHESFHHTRSLVASSVPHVVTIHDMIYEVLAYDFPGHERSTEIKRKSVARADHVICISEQTKSDLVEHFGVSEDKISVVYHGCEWLSQSDEKALRKDMPVRLIHKPYILYVGARNGYKNFGTLLKAFANGRFYNSLDLHCFGGGPFNLDEQAEVRSLGIPEKALKQSSGSDLELAKLYRNASAFIYPSTYEGFGMPPLEAMSMGCPVVASSQAPMPEIIGNAALFFGCMDYKELSSQLKRILEPSEAERLKSLGKTQVAKYSWKKCAEETVKVYEALLK
ncbi:MAG: glycosyltransferase family 4 protein [Akkermansiaceae bacterium]